MLLSLPPLSLYIHIPWCIKKCPYCDFNSHKVRGDLPEAEYIKALLLDLEQELVFVQNRPIQSIFIGGGTPSLFSAECIDKLLQGLAQKLTFADDIEITMEANPGSFEQEKFKAYATAGINRLSLGVQSFSDKHLSALGRVHNANEAQTAVANARDIFANINVDLMHGLPGQNPEQALADLELALSYQPDHLSWYQLTLEPHTEFYSKPPSLPVDESLWQIQELGHKYLATQGFYQYEVSAYSKPTRQAQHNINYWQFGDYLGIGAGAHGKVTQADGAIVRRSKQRQPKAYMQQPFLRATEILEVQSLPFEFMLNALRLTEGVSSQLFQERTGLELDVIQSLLQQAQAKGLLEKTSERIMPTQQGRLFLNNLLELFLS